MNLIRKRYLITLLIQINLSIFILIFTIFDARADCASPSVNLKRHEGLFYGYQVKGEFARPKDESNRILVSWDSDNAKELEIELAPDDILINNVNLDGHILDYDRNSSYTFFIVTPLSNDAEAKKVTVDTKSYIDKLRQVLVFSEYGWSEEDVFYSADVIAYDMNNDSKEDILFFNLNYLFLAVGILDGQWVLIENYSCY